MNFGDGPLAVSTYNGPGITGRSMPPTRLYPLRIKTIHWESGGIKWQFIPRGYSLVGGIYFGQLQRVST